MMLLKSFNTSHVTLYHGFQCDLWDYYLFQYISCYSLSVDEIEEKIEKYLFQYISCYSLSSGENTRNGEQNVSIHLMLLFIGADIADVRNLIRFNTSHVTLYRLRQIQLQTLISRFNTSHVTLYQYLHDQCTDSV